MNQTPMSTDERIEFIKTQNQKIAEIELSLSAVRKERDEMIGFLEQYSTDTQDEINSDYAVVRLVKGRESVKWDEDKFKILCPPDLKGILFKQVITEKLEKKIADVMAKEGKIDANILAEVRLVNPAVNYYKFELK